MQYKPALAIVLFLALNAAMPVRAQQLWITPGETSPSPAPAQAALTVRPAVAPPSTGGRNAGIRPQTGAAATAEASSGPPVDLFAQSMRAANINMIERANEAATERAQALIDVIQAEAREKARLTALAEIPPPPPVIHYNPPDDKPEALPAQTQGETPKPAVSGQGAAQGR